MMGPTGGVGVPCIVGIVLGPNMSLLVTVRGLIKIRSFAFL